MIRVAITVRRGGFTLEVAFETDARLTALFGPSGAGKSTLIGAVAGLIRPARGVIAVEGETLFDGDAGIDVPVHRRRIGVVFQEHRLFPHRSVRGNLLYGCPRGGDRDDELRRVVDVLELGPLLARRPAGLSGGERQRVALGRALASRPRLLLLDEPLASLDRRLRQQIIPYLQRIRDVFALPILYVSHDLTEVLQLTDRLVVLERGTVAGQGRCADLVHDNGALSAVRERGLRNVLAARVVGHEPDEGVSVLQLGAEDDPSRRLVVRRCAAAPGVAVAVGVHPWDVALAAGPVQQVSIQNQVRGTVVRCTMHEGGAIVEVDIGAPLIVEVSRRSAGALGLAPGRPVVCLIKSHALEVLGAA